MSIKLEVSSNTDNNIFVLNIEEKFKQTNNKYSEIIKQLPEDDHSVNFIDVYLEYLKEIRSIIKQDDSVDAIDIHPMSQPFTNLKTFDYNYLKKYLNANLKIPKDLSLYVGLSGPKVVKMIYKRTIKSSSSYKENKELLGTFIKNHLLNTIRINEAELTTIILANKDIQNLILLVIYYAELSVESLFKMLKFINEQQESAQIFKLVLNYSELISNKRMASVLMDKVFKDEDLYQSIVEQIVYNEENRVTLADKSYIYILKMILNNPKIDLNLQKTNVLNKRIKAEIQNIKQMIKINSLIDLIQRRQNIDTECQRHDNIFNQKHLVYKIDL